MWTMKTMKKKCIQMPKNVKQTDIHTIKSWIPVFIPHPAKRGRVGFTPRPSLPRLLHKHHHQSHLKNHLPMQVLLQLTRNQSCQPRIWRGRASLICCRKTCTKPNLRLPMELHHPWTTPKDQCRGSGSQAWWAPPLSPSTPPPHPPMKSEPWDCLMIQIPHPFPFPSSV